MERSRFSLILLEPGEVYFEDFSSELSGDGFDKHSGRLKFCSKSLVFEPDELKKPLIKILFKNCNQLSNSNGVLLIKCDSYAELLAGNVIAPYKFIHQKTQLYFCLHYISVDDCLEQLLQLQRASTLMPRDHNSMVAAIAHSRQSRFKFDPNWLEDMYETVLVQLEVGKVSPLIVNPGRVLLSSTTLYLQFFNNAESFPVLRISLKHVREVILRRFLLQHVGLELLFEGTVVPHLYLSFKNETDRQTFYDILLQQSSLQLKELQPEIMTLQWQNGAISNYEYLLYINKLADRSFNDLTQYPVFPWVLKDYSSSTLDLSNPKVYRDLSKPIGALNSQRLQKLKLRRDEMSPPKFLYGSHYSAPGLVLFYLIRKFPQYMLCLQNGRFDHPDRIFFCMEGVWRNIQENISDFKELIPEFYDLDTGGDFLVNMMGVDLGTRHDGVRVKDVVLPPWCNGAADFVRILREALESDFVSRSLPAWIDLIFGFKQRGAAAEEANNVFYHLCYEGAVDLNAISDPNERHAIEIQIMEFGQIPKQIFHRPHPPRVKPSPVGSPFNISDFKINVSDWKSTCVASHKELVCSVSLCNDVAISVGKDSVLKELRCSSGQLIRSVQLPSAGISACTLLPDEVTVILGTFDNRIIVFELECSTVVDEVRTHEDAISCLCYNAGAKILLSGSWDGTVRVWPLCPTFRQFKRRLKDTLTARFDCEEPVTCVAIERNGELAACGTKGGEVSVFQVSTSTAAQLKFRTHSSAVTAISINETTLISCDNTGFQVYDVPSGLLIHSASQSPSITCLAWLDLTLVFGTECGTIECWDLRNVKLLEIVNCHDSPVSCLTASACGRYLLSGEGKSLFLRSLS